MKLLISSDIHGSAYYCEKLLEAKRREETGRMLLLGDVLYHGPRNDLPRDYSPKKVISMLNEHRNEIYCVRGNCEAEVDQMVLEFPVLADYCLLPAGGGSGAMIFCTHGHVFNEKHLPPMTPGDALLFGHTHVPLAVRYGEYYFLNPGSVSIPKNGSVQSYAVLEDGVFSVRKLESGDEVCTIKIG